MCLSASTVACRFRRFLGADDDRTFTATTLLFALIVLNGVLTVVAFAGVLWMISRQLYLSRHTLR
jgi:hypothetical protein